MRTSFCAVTCSTCSNSTVDGGRGCFWLRALLFHHLERAPRLGPSSFRTMSRLSLNDVRMILLLSSNGVRTISRLSLNGVRTVSLNLTGESSNGGENDGTSSNDGESSAFSTPTLIGREALMTSRRWPLIGRELTVMWCRRVIGRERTVISRCRRLIGRELLKMGRHWPLIGREPPTMS